MDATLSIQDLAAKAASHFETATREDGQSFTRQKDGAPDWLGELIHEAHDDMLPDDWRYACIRAAVDHIAENGEDEDSENDFADSYVDVYTSALTDWLGSHSSRPGYVDYARREFGSDGADIMDAIRLGQYMEASEVFSSVLQSLRDHEQVSA